jgi:plastocyanin
MRYLSKLVWVLAAALFPLGAQGIPPEPRPVTGDVVVVARETGVGVSPKGRKADASDVVVWLIPADGTAPASTPLVTSDERPRIVQRNKTFEPHVIAVEVGTEVEFPNEDPFFHNIFSLFDGKRFDLGLYESGTTRTVRFDRPGVSFLFCNIHPEMSAVVVVVETHYFAVSDRSGHLLIHDVPDGRYEMHVWYERSLQQDLKALARRVIISDSNRSLDVIRVVENPNFTSVHKNKYGEDYVPPPPSTYINP